MKELTIKEKRAWMLGLLTKCPFDRPRYTCPAKGFRILDLKERFKLSKIMSEQQIDAIIAHHTKCMKERNLEQV